MLYFNKKGNPLGKDKFRYLEYFCSTLFQLLERYVTYKIENLKRTQQFQLFSSSFNCTWYLMLLNREIHCLNWTHRLKSKRLSMLLIYQEGYIETDCVPTRWLTHLSDASEISSVKKWNGLTPKSSVTC